MTIEPFKHCAACNSPRTGDACRKCGGPLREPHPDWEWPRLPDVEPIRALAREKGYAVGVHGTLERDLDLIAAPWTDAACSPQELAEHVAQGINGVVLAPEQKPLGRWSCNIQIDGWYKLIDLSVMPRQPPRLRELVRRGWHFAQSPESYTLDERQFVIESLSEAGAALGQEGSSPADGALGRRDRSVHAEPLNPSETNHG